MEKYRIGATWMGMNHIGGQEPISMTWELYHKPTQAELDTLAREDMSGGRESYVPGTMRITEYTDLSDDEEK